MLGFGPVGALPLATTQKNLSYYAQVSATSTTIAYRQTNVGKRITLSSATSFTIRRAQAFIKLVTNTPTVTLNTLKQFYRTIPIASATVRTLTKNFVRAPISTSVVSVRYIYKMIPKTVATTSATTSTLIKNIGKQIATAQNNSVTVQQLKLFYRTLAVSQTSNPIVNRTVLFVRSIPVSAVSVVSRIVNINKTLTRVQSSNTFVSKSIQKTVSLTSGSAALLTKAVNKTVSMSTGSIASVRKQFTRTVALAQTTVIGVAKNIAHTILQVSNTSPFVQRGLAIFKMVSTVQPSVVSRSNTTSKIVTVAAYTNTYITRVVNLFRSFVVNQQPMSSIARQFSARRTISQTNTPVVTNSQQKMFVRLVYVAQSTYQTLAKSIAKQFTLAQSSVVSRSTSVSKTISTVSAQVVSVAKQTQFYRTLQRVQGSIASVQYLKSINKVISTTNSSVASVARKVANYRVIAAISNPVVSVAKSIVRTLAAVSSSVQSVTKSVNKNVSAVSSTVASTIISRTTLLTIAVVQSPVVIVNRLGSYLRTLSVVGSSTPMLKRTKSIFKSVTALVSSTVTTTKQLYLFKYVTVSVNNVVSRANSIQKKITVAALTFVDQFDQALSKIISVQSSPVAVVSRVANYYRTLNVVRPVVSYVQGIVQRGRVISTSVTTQPVVSRVVQYFRTINTSVVTQPIVTQTKNIVKTVNVVGSSIVSFFKYLFKVGPVEDCRILYLTGESRTFDVDKQNRVVTMAKSLTTLILDTINNILPIDSVGPRTLTLDSDQTLELDC